MQYEHKKKDGTVASVGELQVTKKGKKILVVKDAKGKIIYKEILSKSVNLIDEIFKKLKEVL